MFVRAGKATGNTETYDLTDIDRSASVGLSLKGTCWSRADDTAGLIGIDNGISAARQQYLTPAPLAS